MSVEWGGSVGPRSPKDGLFLALTAAPLHSCVTESSARSALALYPLRARAHIHAHTRTLIYTHKEMDLDLTPSPLAPRAEASSPAVPADGTPDDGAPPGRGRAGAGTGGGTATPGATTQGGRADQDSRLFQQAVRDLRQRLKSDKVTKRKVNKKTNGSVGRARVSRPPHPSPSRPCPRRCSLSGPQARVLCRRAWENRLPPWKHTYIYVYIHHLIPHLPFIPPSPPKDAYRDLAHFLASATTLASLDAVTLDAHPAEKVPSHSWPALVSATLAGLREDLKGVGGGEARRRPPDPAPVRSLKALIGASDAPGRWPGVESPLATRAAGLVAYVADGLAAYAAPGGPAVAPGSVGAELIGLLRSSILTSPSLCAAVPAPAWGALVEAWAAPGLTGHDPSGAAAILAGALRRNAGGLTGRARAQTASGLAQAFGSAAAGRVDARTCATLLMAGAIFLARHGLDMGRPGCARLADAGGGLLCSAWAAAGRGDGRARDAAVAFVRAALAVGGLDGAGLAGARAAVASEISRPGFEWVDRGAAAAAAAAAPVGGLPPHPRLPGPPLITASPPLHVGPLTLGRHLGALLALAAGLEDAATAADPAAWGAGGAAAAGAPPSASPRPVKRARTGAVPSLPDRLAADPGRWAPVVCALLRLRGRPPAHIARALLAALAAPLAGGRGPRPPAAGAPAKPASSRSTATARTADAIAAAWVLRVVADLAAYWPSSSRGCGGEEDGAAGGADEQPGSAADLASTLTPLEADTTAGDASDGDDGDLDADWGGRGWVGDTPASTSTAGHHWASLCGFAAAWFAAPGGAPAAPADAAALALAAAARAGLLPPATFAPLPCRLLACPPLVTPIPSAAALTLVSSLSTPDLSAGGPRGGGGAAAATPAAADAAARSALLARLLSPAAGAAHPELVAAAVLALLDARSEASHALTDRARRAAAAAASAWASPAGVVALTPGDGAWGSPTDPATVGSESVRAAGTAVPEAADEEGEFLERSLPTEALSAEERLRSAARARRVGATPPPAPPLRGTLSGMAGRELACKAAYTLCQALAAAQAGADAVEADAEDSMAVDGEAPGNGTGGAAAAANTQTTQAGNHAVLDPLGRRRAATAARDAAATALFGVAAVAAALACELGSGGGAAASPFGPGSPLLAAAGSAISRAGPAIVEVAQRVGAPGGGDRAMASADPVVDGAGGRPLDRWAGLCAVLGAAARGGGDNPDVVGALSAAAAAPFGAAARELGRLFADADAAVGGTAAACAAASLPTTAPGAAPGDAAAEAAALYDEDLDASAAASSSSRSPAVRATARRAACLRALAALATGPDPETAGSHLKVAVDMVAGTEDGSIRGAHPPPPTTLWIAIAGALVDAAAAGSTSARAGALELATTQTGDLLSRGRAMSGGLAAAVATVSVLADAWPRPPISAGAPAVQAAKAVAAGHLGAPLLACLEIARQASPCGDLNCAASPPHDKGPQSLPGRLRAALAGAAAAVLVAGGAGGWVDGEPAHDAAITATMRGLGDVSYAARLASAPAAARMLPMYARRANVYAFILDMLVLPTAGDGGGGDGPTPFGHPQRVETALATLALTAPVDDGAEVRGLHALLMAAAQAVGVAAAAPAAAEAAAAGPGTAKDVRKAVSTAAGAGRSAEGVRRAAAAALRSAAAALGYPSRSAHLAWRLPDIGHALAGVKTAEMEAPGSGSPLSASALAAAVVGAVGGRLARSPSPSSTPPARAAAFLRVAAHALVAPYALAGREADLVALANAAVDGEDEATPGGRPTSSPLGRLFSTHWGALVAAVVPASAMYGLSTNLAADGEVVGAVLNGGAALAAVPDVDDRDEMFHDALPGAVVGILARARAGVPGDDGPRDGLRIGAAAVTQLPPPPLPQPWMPPAAAAAAARKLVSQVALNNEEMGGTADGAPSPATGAAADGVVARGLGGLVPLRALTIAEARLRAARAPRHRAAALGPVRATLALLGPAAGGAAQAGAALALLCRAATAGGADLAGPVAALAGFIASQARAGDGDAGAHAAAEAALFAALPRLVAATVQVAGAVAAASAASSSHAHAPSLLSFLPPAWTATTSTTNDAAFSPAAQAAGLADLAAFAASLVEAAAAGAGCGVAALAAVDPLPPGMPALEGVRAALAAALAGRGGAEPWARRLTRFAGRAGGVPPPARAEAARLLRAELGTAVGAAASTAGHPWSRAEDGAVRGAAWELVRVVAAGRAGRAGGGGGDGGEAAVEEVAALAAAVLAEAGPFATPKSTPATAPGVDPVATTMLPGADLEDGIILAASTTAAAALGSSPGPPRSTPPLASRRDPATPALAGGAVLPALTALLPMLASRVTGGRPAIALPAQATLEVLLSLPRGAAALAACDAATAAALAPFTPDLTTINDLRRGQYPGPVPPADVAAAMLGEAGLWAPPSSAAVAAGSPGAVGRWVRRLAATLLHMAAAPELRAVASAAAASAAAAELLLPLAFADAARGDPTGRAGRRAALSGAVASHLLPSSGALMASSFRNPTTTPAPAAVRILLATLDHLRSVRADAILARGPPRHPDAAGEGEGGEEDGVDACAVDWASAFWLDLPYLGVAAAALGAGCPTAALLYAELEAEARGGVPLLGGGGGRSGSGAAAGAAAAPPLTFSTPTTATRTRRLGADLGSVLLAAHRASPDPDGVYFAAAAAGGADASLALFQLAGDWAAVAAVTDAAAVGARARGGVGGGPALAARAAGLPAALAHMGCRAAVAAVSGGGALMDARAEAAWRMGQWREVGGAAPASPAATLPAAPASSQSSASSFHASVCACLTALEDGDLEGAGSTLAAARAGVVAGLAESAPVAAGRLVRGEGGAAGGAPYDAPTIAADPAIVRLQMLANLDDALGLLASAAGSLGQTPGRSEAALAAVEAAWVRREASALGPSPRDGSAYEAAEPMLALRRAVSRALGAPGAERRALTAAAHAARRAGAGPPALAALADLRSPIEAAMASVGGTSIPAWLAPDTTPTAPWRVEEAKLLWARGQAGAAVRTLRSLLDEEKENGADAAGSPPADPLWRPVTTALLGKWLGVTRAAGAGAALATLTEAANAADELLEADRAGGGGGAPTSSATARVACRASFRLADFADGLARAAAARRATPDWQAARAVVEAKAIQAAEIAARLSARAAGRAGDDADGRNLAQQHRMLMRVIEADTEDQARLGQQQAAWTGAALEHYRRALEAGGDYDLRAVARLVSVFLEAGPADPAVVAAAAPAFASVPSYKFVPLVYQVASRLGGAASGGGGGGAQPPAPSSQAFGHVVARLMARLATDHPHHTLWQLYALSNGGRGRGGPGAGAGGPAAAAAAAAAAATAAAPTAAASAGAASGAGSSRARARASTRVAAATRAAAAVPGLEAAVDEDKAAAAAAVSAAVARASPHLARLVAQTETLGEAYMDISALGAAREASRVGVPSATRRAAATCTDLPPTSRALPVRPDADYADAPRFAGFGPAARFVGGINRPKLVTVADSAGATHKELVKAGQDDPRQDAVMQQAWCLVTALLAADPASRARRLRVRTYRVVPLSPGVGVMQWVEDTATLFDILVGHHATAGAGGVHARHAPRAVAVSAAGASPADNSGGGGSGGGAPAVTTMKPPLSYMDALRKMQSAATPSTARPAFDAVCARFPPALRHWFAEAFRSPPAWHAARTAYTRSTAAASMAGYVIGLGDRHAHNILVDARTADVIHIDLGIAFEQGRFLNVPEVVPFRLTRDVVDGMGPAGVEGPFRRCCEAALAVLRGGREAVTTVVGVLVHDPLYRWQLTPVGARRRQALEGEEAEGTVAGGGGRSGASDGPQPPSPPANADAARALLRVRQKLAGLDASGGDGAPLSVEAQVRVLLHEAADPGRLCRMYVGWAPWL